MRPFARFVILVAAGLGVAVSGASNETVAKPTRTTATTTSRADLKSAMRRPWEDHINTRATTSSVLWLISTIPTTARLLFERAGDLGLAEAAMALGATYDAAELEKPNLRGIGADDKQAKRWYERALELGASEADIPIAPAWGKIDRDGFAHGRPFWCRPRDGFELLGR